MENEPFRHPLERERLEVLRVAGAARRLLAHQRRLLARGLVADEEAVLDEVPALRLDALVVVAAGRERAGRGLVGVERDVGRGELQLAELVERRERGVREVAS